MHLFATEFAFLHVDENWTLGKALNKKFVIFGEGFVSSQI